MQYNGQARTRDTGKCYDAGGENVGRQALLMLHWLGQTYSSSPNRHLQHSAVRTLSRTFTTTDPRYSSEVLSGKPWLGCKSNRLD